MPGKPVSVPSFDREVNRLKEGQKEKQKGNLKISPEIVFHYFKKISEIPRESYHEKQISDYLKNFARSRGYEVHQDPIGNIIVIIPAAEGWEGEEPLILQGHMDMVCEKRPGSHHDFSRDPIELCLEGDMLHAKDTTLGGDDGIAVAMMLAVMDLCTEKRPGEEYAATPILSESEKKLKGSHPRLELIFTVSEETGMEGAENLDVSPLKGHRLLNLDSENEGHLLTGCAGGAEVQVVLPLGRQKEESGNKTRLVSDRDVQGNPARNREHEGVWAEVSVTGGKGGHSGQDIHLGKSNADEVLGRALLAMEESGISYELYAVSGGTKDNAIPFEAKAGIRLADPQNYEAAEKALKILQRDLTEEYRVTDPDLKVSLHQTADGETASGESIPLTGEEKTRLIFLLSALPDGVQKMSGDIPGLVETSLNLGILQTDERGICLTFLLRSSLDGSKKYLEDRMKVIAEQAGADFTVVSAYPAWEYRPDSPLQKKMTRIWRELTGKDPVKEVIHAGVECGLLGKKIPELDAVSIGPDLYDIHTFREHLSVSSAGRVWEYVLRILTDRDA